MNKDVYEKILFMLDKIARKTGELEDDSIYNLESQFNIHIKEEDISQLRKWHLRTRTDKDRSLAYAMPDIEEFSSQLNLSKDLKESTAYIYKIITKKDLLKWYSIEKVALALIYIG